MTRFTHIFIGAVLLLPFAIGILLQNHRQAVWQAPKSINPDIDITRHYFGDGK